jgi:uncharacterized membrane protein
MLDTSDKVAESPRSVKESVRAKLADAAATIDLGAQRLAMAVRTWLPGPIALAITTGAGLWAIHRPQQLGTLDTNKLREADRISMGIWVLCAFLGYLLIYAVAAVVRRRATGAWNIAGTVAAVTRRLFPLLALPLVGALSLPNIEKDSPKLTLFYAAVAAAIVARGVYAWVAPREAVSPLDAESDAESPPAADPLSLRAACAAAVTALWAAYAYFFSTLAITNHRALNTRTTDLGYYDNIFFQSIHGRPLGCSFIKMGYHGSAHFDPILILLSPFYLLYPRAEFLLVLQSVWLGSGVIPIYLLAREKLGGRAPALLFAAVYALCPAMHGANMYEFHSLTLLAPALVWVLYLLETRNISAYYVAVAIALLCREDVALVMCFVGAYAVLSDNPKISRTGWITIVVSLVYFVIVKRFFMTSADIFMAGGKTSYSFAYYYDDLIPNKTGLRGLFLSLVTNPAFVLKTMLTEPKVQYLLLIFLPVAWLPFLAKKGRVMLVYGLLFTLLASRSAVYSIHFQYSSVLYPIAFVLTPIALKRVAEAPLSTFGLDGHRLSRALLGACFAASVLVSWKFGGVLENHQFKGGFVRVTRKLSEKQKANYAWVSAQIEKIPRDASVGVSNKMGPHVSNRMQAYFYPEKGNTDYIFLDEGELKGKDLEKHNRAVQRGQISLVSRKDRMALFKRNTAKAQPATPAPTRPGEGRDGAAPGDGEPGDDRERRERHEGREGREEE